MKEYLTQFNSFKMNFQILNSEVQEVYRYMQPEVIFFFHSTVYFRIIFKHRYDITWIASKNDFWPAIGLLICRFVFIPSEAIESSSCNVSIKSDLNFRWDLCASNFKELMIKLVTYPLNDLK